MSEQRVRLAQRAAISWLILAPVVVLVVASDGALAQISIGSWITRTESDALSKACKRALDADAEEDDLILKLKSSTVDAALKIRIGLLEISD